MRCIEVVLRQRLLADYTILPNGVASLSHASRFKNMRLLLIRNVLQSLCDLMIEKQNMLRGKIKCAEWIN